MKRLLVAMCLCACTISPSRSRPVHAGETAKAPRKQSVIKISRDTTNITGPLDSRGYVDFARALNEFARKGVTADNNAAIPLLSGEIFNEFFKERSPDKRGELVDQFGIPELPKKKSTFVEAATWHIDREFAKERFRCRADIWDTTTYPRIAGWLSQNETMFPMIIEASKRPRFYCPVLTYKFSELDLHEKEYSRFAPTDDAGLELPDVSLFKDILRNTQIIDLMLVRAMLRLNNKQHDAAWVDIVVAHRWSQLIGQFPQLTGYSQFCMTEENAYRATTSYITRAKLTVEDIEEVISVWKRLPHRHSLVDMFDRVDRWRYLDTVCRLQRYGWYYLQIMTGGAQQRADDKRDLFLATYVNWNEVLREGNRWYDRFVDALKMPAGVERRHRLKTIDEELNRHGSLHQLRKSQPPWLPRIRDASNFVGGVIMNDHTRMLQGLFQPHTCLAATEVCAKTTQALAMHSPTYTIQFDDRRVTFKRMAEVCLALERHKLIQGTYPQDLSNLSLPDMNLKVTDVYSDRPLIYQLRPDGYDLISVGRNGIRDTENDREGEDDDDIIITKRNGSAAVE